MSHQQHSVSQSCCTGSTVSVSHVTPTAQCQSVMSHQQHSVSESCHTNSTVSVSRVAPAARCQSVMSHQQQCQSVVSHRQDSVSQSYRTGSTVSVSHATPLIFHQKLLPTRYFKQSHLRLLQKCFIASQSHNTLYLLKRHQLHAARQAWTNFDNFW